MLIFDAYAWIEYFAGSDRGKKVRDIVNSNETIITPAMALFEVKNKLKREKKESKKIINYILGRSIIEPITSEIALLAADVRSDYNLGAADAIIYATAQIKKGKLVTGDLHFKSLQEVEFI